MPLRDPALVQLDFPQLTSDLINQLRLTGTLGVMNFLPEVRPTFIVGSRGLTIAQEQPVYLPAEVFSGEILDSVGAATFWDTGQLLAGDYDVIAWIEWAQLTGTNTSMGLEHRNAADAATLATWFIHNQPGGNMTQEFRFGIQIATNERIRVRTNNAWTGRAGSTGMVKRRVVP